jgi:hypothetical protein
MRNFREVVDVFDRAVGLKLALTAAGAGPFEKGTANCADRAN